MRFFVERTAARWRSPCRRSSAASCAPPGRGPFRLNRAARAPAIGGSSTRGPGAVSGTHPAVGAAPRGAWIGVTTDAADRLVLASGDQQIVVWDPATRYRGRFASPRASDRRSAGAPTSRADRGRRGLDRHRRAPYRRRERLRPERTRPRHPRARPPDARKVSDHDDRGRRPLARRRVHGATVRTFDVRIAPDCAAANDSTLDTTLGVDLRRRPASQSPRPARRTRRVRRSGRRARGTRGRPRRSSPARTIASVTTAGFASCHPTRHRRPAARHAQGGRPSEPNHESDADQRPERQQVGAVAPRSARRDHARRSAGRFDVDLQAP